MNKKIDPQLIPQHRSSWQKFTTGLNNFVEHMDYDPLETTKSSHSAFSEKVDMLEARIRKLEERNCNLFEESSSPEKLA